MAVKRFTIRIDDELLHKLQFVADYEVRTAASQTVILIRKCIKDYEKEYGKIEQ